MTDQAPSTWSAELEQHLFKGSRFMQEAVFFHKASKTLILTDMIENIETHQMKPCRRFLENGQEELSRVFNWVG